MLSATEHQLRLIVARSQKLEETVKAQVLCVKELAGEKNHVADELRELRQRVAELERDEATLTKQHGEATLSLREAAVEYSKTQLLAKRYQNTVAELRGQCKSIVLARGQPSGFSMPDACTVEVSDEVAFCFDSVVEEDGMTAESLGCSQMARDTLSGFNTCTFSFGPTGAGKTSAIFGGNGAVRLFVTELFDTLVDNEVTHFSMRCSFGELHNDHFIDHLGEFGHTLSVGATTEIRSLQVQTVEEVLSYVDLGLERVRGQNRKEGHVFFALSVENFNRRGHFRKGSALFVDLAGATTGSAASRGPDSQWVMRSLSSVCNAIAMLASGDVKPDDLPGGTLMRLLREALGGNAKSCMIVAVSESASHDENMSALTYASHFKNVVNSPTPYDIPAELQRLNLEASSA
jgi:hypothetical protein